MSLVQRFWDDARAVLPRLPAAIPAAWAFGAADDARQADELAALVVAGIKTATSSSAWDYDESGEPLPAVGDLDIVLDGRGHPRAVIETTAVAIASFDEVDAAHAAAEGEGDRTLEWWRREHEAFWRRNSARGFATDMPVVCQHFAVLYTGTEAG